MPQSQSNTKDIEIEGVGVFAVPAQYNDVQIRAHILNMRMNKPELFGLSRSSVGLGPEEQAQPEQQPSFVDKLFQSVLPKVNVRPSFERAAERTAFGLERIGLGGNITPNLPVIGPIPASAIATLPINMAGSVAQTAADIGRAAYSPAGATLAAATMAGGVPAAIGLTAASGGAIVQGGREFLSPRQPGENEPEALERQLTGAAEAAVGMGGIAGVRPGKLRSIAQGAMNEGESRIALAEAADVRAKTFRQKTNALIQTAHDVAQNEIRAVGEKVTAKLGERAIAADPVRSAMRGTWDEYIAIPEKLPSSMRSIMSGPLDEASVFRGAGTQGRSAPGTVNVSEIPAAVRQRMGIEDLMPGGKGGGTDFFSWNEAQQYRTRLGREAYGRGSASLPGNVRVAMQDAYKTLSNEMAAAAAKAGQGSEWVQANGKWRNYLQDKDTLSGILEGENAKDITSQIRGKDLIRVRETVRRNSEELGTGYISAADVIEESRWHRLADTANEWAKPTKLNVILAAITSGTSVLPGKILQQPRVLDALSKQRRQPGMARR